MSAQALTNLAYYPMGGTLVLTFFAMLLWPRRWPGDIVIHLFCFGSGAAMAVGVVGTLHGGRAWG